MSHNHSQHQAAMIVALFIHLSLLCYTYSHFKCCSALLISPNLNLSVMRTHDFTHHRKPQTYTSKFTASGLIHTKERFKDLLTE